MRKPILLLLLALGLCGAALAVAAQSEGPKKPVREIFIPFKELEVVLEKQPQRVLLPRDEYLELLKKAEKTAEKHAPQAWAAVSAEYVVAVGVQRARITGTLAIDVLESGVHAVPLDLDGVTIASAALDKKGAAIGRPSGGAFSLFIEGVGRHELVLDMVAPVETTASQQMLRFRLPRAATVETRLTVPGDVEIKGGAQVVRREVDAAAKLTRFTLLTRDPDVALAMTLNSHLQRQQRAVVASTVLLSEVTQAYEKLHAAVSLSILYRAVDRFRFVVPEGFEILEVESPLLSRWDVAADGTRKVLNVQLREQTTEPVVLKIAAIKTPCALLQWHAPRLEPLDVEGHSAVVGLLVEDRLRIESLRTEGLMPIDVLALRGAMPESVLRATPGNPALRPVAAYYAPQGTYTLSADFQKPAAGVAVTTNLVLTLKEQGQEVDGAVAVLPEVEKRFALTLSTPAGWTVDRVLGPNDQPLAFETYGEAEKPGRIEVRLPQGIAADQQHALRFHASRTPTGWLGTWDKQTVAFPVFAVVGATRDEGTLSVVAGEDMDVRPDKIEQLTPLDENDAGAYAKAGVPANLAWRYQAPGYAASLVVSRPDPRVTARTFAFFQIRPEVLGSHYEIIYDIDEARARHLRFSLPVGTPKAVTIRGLDGLKIKESNPEEDGGLRCWTVLLEDARRGKARLAVDFDQPLTDDRAKAVGLPMLMAEGVAYQSGLVAVEGSAELDVQVKTDARRVDVGELVDADYQPGRRLLGAYGFAGDPPPVKVEVARTPGYRLLPAIVAKATLDTYLAAEGTSQTEGNFTLHTKVPFLELKLPRDAELWAVSLDGNPVKPQREGDCVLVSFPATAGGAPRTLQFVYSAPVRSVVFSSKIEVLSPRLRLRGGRGTAAEEVPLNDLVWRLHVPTGHEVTATSGNVTTQELVPPRPAAVDVAGMLYALTGGVNPFYGVHEMAAMESARLTKKSGYYRGAKSAAQREAMEVYVDDSKSMVKEDKDKGGLAETFRTEKDAIVSADAPAPTAPPPTAEPAPVEQTKAEAPPLGVPGPDDDPFSGNVAGGKPAEKRDGQSPNVREAITEEEARRQETEERSRQQMVIPRKAQTLLGVRSLKIGLEQSSSAGATTFRSLGVDPTLVVRVANRTRFETLGQGLALLVLLWGLVKTNGSVRGKVRFVLCVAFAATVLPLVWHSIEVARVANIIFFAASALVPYYLLAGLVKWCWAGVRAVLRGGRRVAAVASLMILATAAGVSLAAESAAGESPDSKAGKYVVQIVEPGPAAPIPEDAILVPYDSNIEEGPAQAEKILVPYAKFVELWNLAHPDKKIDATPPPAPFALAGAAYSATLEGEEYVLFQGQLQVEVFGDEFVQVPLRLGGGVLAKAELDGKPARLQIVAAEPLAPQAKSQSAKPVAQTAPAGDSLAVLHVQGKGRHKLELALRMRISRQGGWRAVSGSVPVAPATALNIVVPDAKTEVRLGQVTDRRAYDTEKPAEQISTAIGQEGQVNIQWRPRIAEGQVDQSLTAQSTAVFDIEEDGLRLLWRVVLDFRRSQRERFTLSVPKGFLVERVEGPNVRGWTLKDGEKRQTVEVELLKAAKDREEFTVSLWHAGQVGQAGQKALAEFDVPAVEVSDAALSAGELTIRRSPLLELRTLDLQGVSRTDLGGEAAKLAGEASASRPLGVKPYQAYRFATMPFTVRLAAQPTPLALTATVQTVVNIADARRTLESRIDLVPKGKPIHRVEILLPDELTLDRVAAPDEYQWAVTRAGGRSLLTVYLAKGREESTSIILRGRLAKTPSADKAVLPRVEVLGTSRQEGSLAVQVDPAYDVETQGLVNCEPVLLSRVFAWLNPEQRQVTRLGLEYRRADYSGMLRLVPRKADVSCDTITNVCVTGRAIEETILLDFSIQNAGVRSVSFLLPGEMKGARISALMLRQKTIEELSDGRFRVGIEFQEEVMGEARVLVRNDRVLGRDVQYVVALPTVENAKTNRRYITLESTGRDELEVIGPPAGIEPLHRQLKEWQSLATKLGNDITQAYVVRENAAGSLRFGTRQRATVKTAGARILLAQADIVLDAAGAYRASQIYRIDNRTEQYLEIRLPPDAELWTAKVAGEPVKPMKCPEAKDGRSVRIPLVKTAVGDLDYEVALRYGGQVKQLGEASLVDFPLIHAANVKPESSVVQLYVPKSHQWVRFHGTMRAVMDEADVQNEYVSYQNKRAQSLLEASRQGDIFQKIRAANSLKSVKQEMDAYNSSQGSSGNGTTNSSLRNNLDDNGKIMQQAEAEVRNVVQGTQTLGRQYNRSRMNDLYEGQQLNRSRNVVQDVSPNWTDATVQQPAAQNQKEEVTFNQGWLAKNGLIQAPGAAPSSPAKPGGEQGVKGGEGKELAQGNVIWKGNPSSPVSQPKAPEIDEKKAGGKGKGKDGKGGKNKPADNGRGPDDGDGREQVLQAQKYYDRVQQQNADVQQGQNNLGLVPQSGGFDVSNPNGTTAGNNLTQTGSGTLTLNGGGTLTVNVPQSAQPQPTAAMPAPNTPPIVYPNGDKWREMTEHPVADLVLPIRPGDGQGQMGGQGGGGGFAYGAAAANPAQAAATGLVSLDIALPERDGIYEVHRFTTPRGEVELKAYAVSREWLSSTASLGIVAAILLGAWAVVRFVRRGGTAWITGSYGSTVLVVLGLASLVTGLLPGVGLVALVTGVVVKIRRLGTKPVILAE